MLAIGAACAGIGTAVLAGWQLGSVLLAQGVPAGRPMAYNAAVAFVLLGVAFLALAAGHPGARVAPAAGAVLIGAATLAESAARARVGVDHALLLGGGALPWPARMAPSAAIGLALAGVAVLLLPRARRGHGAPAVAMLGAAVGVLGVVPLFGFALHIPTTSWLGQFNDAAVNTAFGLSAVGVAVVGLAWHPDDQFDSARALTAPAVAAGLVLLLLSSWAAADRPGPAGSSRPDRLAAALLVGVLPGLVAGMVVYFVQAAGRRAAELAAGNRRLTEQILERRLAEEGAARQAALLRVIVDGSGDGIVVADEDDRVLLLNPAAEEILGSGAIALPPDRWAAGYGLFHPDGAAPLAPDEVPLARAIRGEACDDVEVVLRSPALPERRTLRATGRPLRTPDGRAGGVVVFRDVTERKRAEQALRASEERLRESEERFRAAFDHAPIGIALTTPDAPTTAVFTQVNRALATMLGHAEADLIGRPLDAFIHPDDLARNRALDREVLAGRIASFQAEMRYRHADGHWVQVLQSIALVHDEHGAPRYRIKQIEDITVRKHAEEQLAYLAFHDQLTDLPNRLLFSDHLALALARARRSGNHPAVLFLDLDGFKRVNDALGHHAGDQLLQAVARRLRATLRPADTIARLAGDEFTVLCDDTRDQHDVVAIAERIRAALARPFTVAGAEVVVSASIGITLTDAGDTPDQVLRDADQAMYRAKAHGRANYELFDATVRDQHMSPLDIESGLRRALERDELRVFYQPQVLLGDHEVVGLEALVRWQHPERGLLAPAAFLPVAEESRLVVPLGAWVLERACQDLQAWQRAHPEQPPLRLAVNVAVAQLLRPEFVGQVEGVLARTGLAAERLCLEVTETDLAYFDGAAPSVMPLLKDLGVRLSIDDFGTAYASIDHLRQFPVDEVKIDRSFVAALESGGRGARLSDAIIGLARTVDLDVIAEGVETQEQAERLRHAGCTTAQGYWFAPPRPIDQLDGAPRAPA